MITWLLNCVPLLFECSLRKSYDFRIYAKQHDGKTKNDHFAEMLQAAVSDKQVQAKTVLFDSWYASWKNLKRRH